MTKNYFFSTIGQLRLYVVALLLTLCAAQVNAELLLNESFNYTVGSALYNEVDGTPTNRWWKYGSNPNAPISIVSPALTYNGYQSNAAGASIQLTPTASGEDLYTLLDTVIGEGSVYYAALINISSITDITATNATYFLGLVPQTKNGLVNKGSGTEYARLAVLPGSTNEKFKFGISKSTNTLISTESEYNLDSTYLVVLKYTIVEGTTNDIVTLYINPTSTTEPTNGLVHQTSDGDASITYGGIKAIELRQGGSSTRKMPTLTLDAIRIATTWAELFQDAGGEGGPTPTLTASKSSINFANPAFSGTTYTQTINIKGSNLTNDVTFTSNCANVTLSAASATKEQVSSAAGFDLTLTLTNAETACTDAKLTISSTGATSVNVAYAWTFIPTTDVENLAEFRTKGITAINNETYETFRMKNPFVITYVDGKNTYAQDAEGGIRIADGYGIGVTINYEPGTEIAANSYGEAVGSFGTTFQPYGLTPSGNTVAVTPIDVTLADIEANKAKYADRLVRITDVEFDQTTGTFGSTQITITQGTTSAKMRVFASTTDIKGKDIPSKAHIVGISTSESTVVIAPRAWSDITPLNATSLEQVSTTATCYAAEGKIFVLNNSEEVAIYNLVGTRVATLRSQTSINMPQGIYIVKMGKEVHKVIVK